MAFRLVRAAWARAAGAEGAGISGQRGRGQKGQDTARQPGRCRNYSLRTISLSPALGVSHFGRWRVECQGPVRQRRGWPCL